jgi:hypothetical protein
MPRKSDGFTIFAVALNSFSLGFGLCVVCALMRSCGDDGGYGRRVFAQTAPQAQYGLSGGMALPDASITPGVVDPEAVADITGKSHKSAGIERNICADDFRTGPIRAGIHNFAKLKREACAEYSVAKCDASVEGDHLISIEIGGCPDCLTNLWPQPMDEARIKDHQVEDVLPKLICAGKMTLGAAQKCMATDWVACADRLKVLEGQK